MLTLIFFSVIVLFFLAQMSKISRYSDISKIILIAFIVRIIVMILDTYFLTLPDSGFDATGFEEGGWLWAQEGFSNVLNKYPGNNSYFYTWLISLIYSLFGRNIFIVKFIGIILGISSVFLGWLIAKKLWNKETAIKVGWTIALFPSLILYSVLTLREVYCSFFILLGILGLVNWIKFNSIKSLLLVFLGFYGSMYFHGALIIGGILSSMIISYYYFKRTLKLLLNLKIDIMAIFFITFTSILLILLFSGKIYIPYITTYEDYPTFGWLKDTVSNRLIGDASYGNWTKINSEIELIYKIPIRIVYFLFSPFLWDISKPSHLIGVLDSALYAILIFFIFKNINIILKDPALRVILLILILYLIIYSIGVSNFGAGIRHRSKFVIEIILLAGPLIPRLFWSKKIGQFK